MSELVEFLRARLDEDEQIAQDWQRARLIQVDQYHNNPTKNHVRPFRERVTDAQRAKHRYGFRFDPDRALREVEAKRHILGRWSRSADLGGQYTLRCLALPYDDHPDYRQEWRP
ncbi:DUF6221 family protein [Streptosporangium sp. G12]